MTKFKKGAMKFIRLEIWILDLFRNYDFGFV